MVTAKPQGISSFSPLSLSLYLFTKIRYTVRNNITAWTWLLLDHTTWFKIRIEIVYLIEDKRYRRANLYRFLVLDFQIGLVRRERELFRTIGIPFESSTDERYEPRDQLRNIIIHWKLYFERRVSHIYTQFPKVIPTTFTFFIDLFTRLQMNSLLVRYRI